MQIEYSLVTLGYYQQSKRNNSRLSIQYKCSPFIKRNITKLVCLGNYNSKDSFEWFPQCKLGKLRLIQVQMSQSSSNKLEIRIRIKSMYDKNLSVTDVVVKVPVPQSATSVTYYRVTGTANHKAKQQCGKCTNFKEKFSVSYYAKLYQAIAFKINYRLNLQSVYSSKFQCLQPLV